MEQYIKEAIGQSNPQLEPEPEPRLEPEPQVTIYDFADLLAKNEPPIILTREEVKELSPTLPSRRRKA